VRGTVKQLEGQIEDVKARASTYAVTKRSLGQQVLCSKFYASFSQLQAARWVSSRYLVWISASICLADASWVSSASCRRVDDASGQ
jgi:hypothetical protein